MSKLDITKESITDAHNMEEPKGVVEPNGEKELVYAWCVIVLDAPEGDNPRECVKNFKTKNNLPFKPLSYWGYRNDSKCEVLMYYSMWAESPLEANKSMSKFMNSPNSALTYCENGDIATWVEKVTTLLKYKGAEGEAPGITDGFFVKKQENPEKDLEEFENWAKRALFITTFA